jgi:hypothetical protein
MIQQTIRIKNNTNSKFPSGSRKDSHVKEKVWIGIRSRILRRFHIERDLLLKSESRKA